jgi:hypothetical protein
LESSGKPIVIAAFRDDVIAQPTQQVLAVVNRCLTKTEERPDFRAMAFCGAIELVVSRMKCRINTQLFGKRCDRRVVDLGKRTRETAGVTKERQKHRE